MKDSFIQELGKKYDAMLHERIIHVPMSYKTRYSSIIQSLGRRQLHVVERAPRSRTKFIHRLSFCVSHLGAVVEIEVEVSVGDKVG
jgi:dTDP-4-amino-4,6-dideoxygalactose transaminase